METESLRLQELVDQLGGAEREGLVPVYLRDDVVVVRVEPLGHLHGGDAGSTVCGGAAARHGEVGVQAYLTLRGVVAFRDRADHDARVEDLVVEGEVVGRDVRDACLALEAPVRPTDPGSAPPQFFFVYLPGPVRFDSPFEFAVRADAWESKIG